MRDISVFPSSALSYCLAVVTPSDSHWDGEYIIVRSPHVRVHVHALVHWYMLSFTCTCCHSHAALIQCTCPHDMVHACDSITGCHENTTGVSHFGNMPTHYHLCVSMQYHFALHDMQVSPLGCHASERSSLQRSTRLPLQTRRW